MIMLKATQSTFVVDKMSRNLKRTDDVFVANIKSKLHKPYLRCIILLDTDGRVNDFGHHMLQRSNVGCLMSHDIESQMKEKASHT